MIMELVKQHIGEFALEPKGNIWKINLRGQKWEDGDLSSVVIYSDDTYHRFKSHTGGGPKHFAKHILHLSQSEIDKIPESYSGISSAARNTRYHRTFNLFDVVGESGYNDYIKSRGISEETARRFSLELKDDNVIIPLVENGKRIGSIIRFNTDNKAFRYQKWIIDGYDAPALWPYRNFHKLNSNSVILLFEGAWSVMRFSQLYKGDIFVPFATLGTNLVESLQITLMEFPIIGVKDNDSGGDIVEKQLIEWKENGLNTQIYVPKWDSKVDEKLYGPLYVDEMTDEQLKRMIKEMEQII